MGKLDSRECKLYTNLTLLDFADATHCPKRLPKNKLGGKNELHLDQTTGAFITDADDPELRTALFSSQKIVDKQTAHDSSYNDYHIDVWFLISEWIAPEDVRRFALICQKTRYVVSTAKFWAHLYRRYYNCKSELPDCLQPDNICRMKGYRACVIRSLFYTYPMFSTERLRATPEPGDLIKFKCIGCWFRPEKSSWILCFKFSRNPLMASEDENYADKDMQVVESWEDIDVLSATANCDIHYNREEGNRILIVKTDRFYPPPGFLAPNLILSKIIQPLSQDLRTFKLELTFSEYNGRIVGTVAYDPVKQWKIFRWWEPEYYSYFG